MCTNLWWLGGVVFRELHGQRVKSALPVEERNVSTPQKGHGDWHFLWGGGGGAATRASDIPSSTAGSAIHIPVSPLFAWNEALPPHQVDTPAETTTARRAVSHRAFCLTGCHPMQTGACTRRAPGLVAGLLTAPQTRQQRTHPRLSPVAHGSQTACPSARPFVLELNAPWLPPT